MFLVLLYRGYINADIIPWRNCLLHQKVSNINIKQPVDFVIVNFVFKRSFRKYKVSRSVKITAEKKLIIIFGILVFILKR